MTIQRLDHDQLSAILPLLEQVHGLHCAAEPHRYRAFLGRVDVLNWLEAWVETSQVRILISGTPDAPTGYLAYAVIRKPQSVIRPAQHYAVLEHICVDAPYRGQGIGHQLIAEMRKRLCTEGVARIRATYAAWNEASAALLASEGFVVSTLNVEAEIGAGRRY